MQEIILKDHGNVRTFNYKTPIMYWLCRLKHSEFKWFSRAICTNTGFVLKKSMENMINIRGRVLKEGHDSVMLASIHENQRCCRREHWMTNYEREISYYHRQR
jgi:hypothetical protein